MSAITDDAVLLALKQYMIAELRAVIASATTLQDAEKLLAPYFGGPGGVHDKVRLMRQALTQMAPNEAVTRIID